MSVARRDPRIEAGYWAHVTRAHVEPSDALERAYTAGFLDGGKRAIRSMTELADLVPTLRELIAWLEVDDD